MSEQQDIIELKEKAFPLERNGKTLLAILVPQEWEISQKSQVPQPQMEVAMNFVSIIK